MAGYSLQPSLAARNGRELIVLGIARISTLNQDERSLADQEALYRHWLDEHTDFPYQLTMLASQGSGEYLDRGESVRAHELVESRTLDLVLTEDLARIFRRVHAHLFCEHCEDHETRLVAINDHVDTMRDDWRMHSFFAVFKHESSNKDTANRIRRSLRNRFTNGGAFQMPIFGYVKPRGAKSDADVSKDPAAEPIYEEWWSRLERGSSYAEVSDWLIANNIPLGPACSAKRWSGQLVRNITFNTILKGVRQRNKKMARRINSTGRRKSVNAPPEELLERHCPHLAFIEPGRYDRLIRILKQKNEKYTVGRLSKADPRLNRSKKRIRWPGQNLYCGICGRLFVFGGHGQKEHLMCNGAREYRCWNSATVDGPLAVEKLSSTIFSQLEAWQDFDAAFLDRVNARAHTLDASRGAQLRDFARKLAAIEEEIGNLMKFIRRGDDSASVRDDLHRLEESKAQLLRDEDEMKRTPSHSIEVPPINELKQLAREAFKDLPTDSFEFAELMRKLTKPIFVLPYRLCDGGSIVLRAKFGLQLANLLPDKRQQLVLEEPLTRVLEVDLFNKPQRAQFRKQVVARRAKNETERAVAKALGITVTAAQKAASLDRLMTNLGLTDPYVRVTEPPADCGKLRRHLHARYSFAPLPGHIPE